LLIYVKLNKFVQKEKLSNLQMVSESLTLTFNLLTIFYSSLALLSARWRHFWELSVSELNAVCVFLKTTARESIAKRKFFSG